MINGLARLYEPFLLTDDDQNRQIIIPAHVQSAVLLKDVNRAVITMTSGETVITDGETMESIMLEIIQRLNGQLVGVNESIARLQAINRLKGQ